MKDRKIINTINEELKLNGSDDECDELMINHILNFFYGFNSVCYWLRLTGINKKPNNTWLTYTITLLLSKYCITFDLFLQWYKLRW